MSKKEQSVIVPSVDELSCIRNNVSCPEPNCNLIFKSSSNLKMHLVKHHAKHALVSEHPGSRYACPVPSCKYSASASKSFPKLKFLKQHYLKSHSAKAFPCARCCKGFATQAFLHAHRKLCGAKFLCSCGWEYGSREALATHCKRKSHTPADKDGSKGPRAQAEKPFKADADDKRLVQVCIASPPLTQASDFTVFQTHYVAAIALSELSTTYIIPRNCHIGVQTVETKQIKKSRSTDKKRKSSQETQTAGPAGQAKRLKISAETQTSELLKHKPGCRKIHRSRKRSTETQTKDLMPFLPCVNSESLDGAMFNESSLSNSSTTTDAKRDVPTPLDDDAVWGGGSTTTDAKRDVPTPLDDDAVWGGGSTTTDAKREVPTPLDDDAVWGGGSTTTDAKRDVPMRLDDDAVWGGASCSKKPQSKSFVTTINSEMFGLNSEMRIEPNCDVALNSFGQLDKLCNNETQTEMDALFQPEAEGTSSTETQTTDDLVEDLYSHMCTQTCSDAKDLFDFDLVDIETQTAWPDL